MCCVLLWLHRSSQLLTTTTKSKTAETDLLASVHQANMTTDTNHEANTSPKYSPWENLDKIPRSGALGAAVFLTQLVLLPIRAVSIVLLLIGTFLWITIITLFTKVCVFVFVSTLCWSLHIGIYFKFRLVFASLVCFCMFSDDGDFDRR